MSIKERKLPDGSVFHQLAIPDGGRVSGYIPEETTVKLTALMAEYARLQQDWPPGLRDGITAQIQEGASAFTRLYTLLQDAASGQFSDSLQRAHDSRVLIRKWQPLYEQMQQDLIEVEDQRNVLLGELATQLKASSDYSVREAGSELGHWVWEAS